MDGFGACLGDDRFIQPKQEFGHAMSMFVNIKGGFAHQRLGKQGKILGLCFPGTHIKELVRFFTGGNWDETEQVCIPRCDRNDDLRWPDKG
jgi:hypothetical protein|tara:strand:+ start:248 stop:520 length:273 start_codon:yes stop_codon:yes gene_type:complete